MFDRVTKDDWRRALMIFVPKGELGQLKILAKEVWEVFKTLLWLCATILFRVAAIAVCPISIPLFALWNRNDREHIQEFRQKVIKDMHPR